MEGDRAYLYYFNCRCVSIGLKFVVVNFVLLFLAGFEAGFSESNPEMIVLSDVTFPQIHVISALSLVVTLLIINVISRVVLRVKTRCEFYPLSVEYEERIMVHVPKRGIMISIGSLCTLFLMQGLAIHFRQLMIGDTRFEEVPFSFFFRIVEPVMGVTLFGCTLMLCILQWTWFDREAMCVRNQKTS